MERPTATGCYKKIARAQTLITATPFNFGATNITKIEEYSLHPAGNNENQEQKSNLNVFAAGRDPAGLQNKVVAI